MPVTPVYGFPYQASGDRPNGPDLGGNLALAVEAAIAGLQIPSLPMGIMAAPTVTASTGTTTSSTTETRDAVLGNYTYTGLPGRRYRATLSGRALFPSVVGDRFTVNIRNGGSSTPTAASTLVATSSVVVTAAGFPGTYTFPLSGTFVPGPGAVTLGVFVVRSSGTGTAAPTLACEFYAEDIGDV